MHIRLLGAHQGESRTTGFISILVDDVLAIDAGSLTSTLTFAEQARVTSELNSQYLLDASASWFTPMTHEQASIRAELNSEYLREAALGW